MMLQEPRVGALQFTKFLAVGVAATLVNASIYYLLFKLGVPYALAMPAGFLSGAVIGYFLNSFFTFRAKQRSAAAAVRYLGVNLTSLGVGETALLLMVELMGISLLLSSILTITLTTCLNFVGAKIFVFRARDCR